MRRESHVRFWEGRGVKLPSATRLVGGFQHQQEAERFLEELRERLEGFELELHPEKTRLIEFGRFATEDRRKRGQGKPETFDFLGFTHYCTKSRGGRYRVGRKPVAKRMRRTLKRIKEALCRRKHERVEENGVWLGRVLNGWLNYYAIPTSYPTLKRFVYQLKRLWLRTLRRRSQKDRHGWGKLERLVALYWPKLTIRHPWPNQRFAVNSTQGRSRMP